MGIDIVHEGTKQANKPLAQHIKNYLRDDYVLIGTDGPDDNVLKTKPPLCFNKENAEEVVSAIDKAILAFKENA